MLLPKKQILGLCIFQCSMSKTFSPRKLAELGFPTKCELLQELRLEICA